MYNLQNNDIKSEGGSPIFKLGISSGNELTTVEKGAASNGNTFLKFTFTAPDETTVSHFEWPVDETASNAANKFKSQIARIKHILTKFIDESQLPVANSFDELADKVVALLNGRTAGIKLHVKTTYTWNNFIGIPSYVPFIELDNGTPATKLKIKSQEEGGIDKMVRDDQDSQEDVSAQLSQPVAGNISGANLPF